MFDQDPFFTLSAAAQAGLVGLSLGFVTLIFWALARMFRVLDHRPLSVRIGLRAVMALAVFWLFLWLGPQIYYLYYQAVIPGLPWQIVVKAPPGLPSLLGVMAFAGGVTLADIARGVFGWLLLLFALSAAAPFRPGRLH